MAAALDLHHPIGPYTVGEWLDLPETINGSLVELIYGYLHMSPAPSAKHQRAASRLTRLLADALDVGNRADLEVLLALNVEISTAWRTALIPEVVELASGFVGVTAPPATVEMVVEMWSPGNSRAERETKLAAYASAGMQFLWTVDGDHPHRRPGSDHSRRCPPEPIDDAHRVRCAAQKLHCPRGAPTVCVSS